MISFPDILFKTVVVDPPWRPSLNSEFSTDKSKAHPNKFYKTMDLKDICSIQPPMSKQCHVYIWCISQHVDWGYNLARSWGANPIILLTWKKPGLGVGRFRCNTEHILVARKGSRHGNAFGKGGRHTQATNGTLFNWPRGRHSEKPSEFYAMVENLSPEPRLDMYARVQRDGWHSWGDEIKKDNDIFD